MPENTSLDEVAQRGLEKCLARISGISSGKWRAAMVSTYAGTPRAVISRYACGGCEAVFLNFKDAPIPAIMIADPQDRECISRGFTGHSFPKSEKTSIAEEIMLAELGNILLNALVNSMLNAAKKSAIPDLPLFLEGGPEKMTSALAGRMQLDKECRVVSAAVSLCCDGLASWTLHAFVPEGIARGIEQF